MQATHRQTGLPLAPLIAIVGCDGSGKSTLAAAVMSSLAPRYQLAVCYLGLGSGTLGNRIRRWPLLGPPLERMLSKKARQTRTGTARIPGLPTALVVFGFSLLRYRRFRRVLALRQRGVAVLTDRYPQTEVAGLYDGPGLSAARAGTALVGWLAARERRLYERMASYRPSVVIRLNVDAATALARKPDHDPMLLAEKARVTPLLHFNGARIVDLDACAPFATVQAAAIQIAEQVLACGGQTVSTAPVTGQ